MKIFPISLQGILNTLKKFCFFVLCIAQESSAYFNDFFEEEFVSSPFSSKSPFRSYQKTSVVRDHKGCEIPCQSVRSTSPLEK